MQLSRIRLELARTPDYPEGSAKHGYEFVAPLTKDSHIDAKHFHDVKEHCHVLRFWGDGEPEEGMLRHVGSGWRFDYDPTDDADDEPFFKLDKHTLKTGSYVSVTEQDGIERPFKVVSVMPVKL